MVILIQCAFSFRWSIIRLYVHTHTWHQTWKNIYSYIYMRLVEWWLKLSWSELVAVGLFGFWLCSYLIKIDILMRCSILYIATQSECYIWINIFFEPILNQIRATWWWYCLIYQQQQQSDMFTSIHTYTHTHSHMFSNWMNEWWCTTTFTERTDILRHTSDLVVFLPHMYTHIRIRCVWVGCCWWQWCCRLYCSCFVCFSVCLFCWIEIYYCECNQCQCS